MGVEIENVYSEMYSILHLLGTSYINKIPIKLYDKIKKERNTEYNPEYTMEVSLDKQNTNRHTLAMLAFFQMKYWSSSEKEKAELIEHFQENEEKYEKELRKKYNPDGIFKDNKKEKNTVSITERKEITEYKKKNVIQNIFEKIYKIFITEK